MIGFSIMMWFSSALLIFFSISLLTGTYSYVHGKVFETTNDKKGYEKALGKPVLLIGICVLFSGVMAVVLPLSLIHIYQISLIQNVKRYESIS